MGTGPLIAKHEAPDGVLDDRASKRRKVENGEIAFGLVTRGGSSDGTKEEEGQETKRARKREVRRDREKRREQNKVSQKTYRDKKKRKAEQVRHSPPEPPPHPSVTLGIQLIGMRDRRRLR
jgi:hypothetical protein